MRKKERRDGGVKPPPRSAGPEAIPLVIRSYVIAVRIGKSIHEVSGDLPRSIQNDSTFVRIPMERPNLDLAPTMNDRLKLTNPDGANYLFLQGHPSITTVE